MLTAGAESIVSNVQYTALTDDILISGLTSKMPFDVEFDKPVSQKRRSCRYIRDDIQVRITENRFLFRKKVKTARLVNVSQIGVSIGYLKNLNRGRRVRLTLTFSEGRSFEFMGVIVYRRSADQEMIYGFKFEKLNRQFEEYLLKTGLRLKLKKLSMRA